jgi:hypothetical protein
VEVVDLVADQIGVVDYVLQIVAVHVKPMLFGNQLLVLEQLVKMHVIAHVKLHVIIQINITK